MLSESWLTLMMMIELKLGQGWLDLQGRGMKKARKCKIGTFVFFPLFAVQIRAHSETITLMFLE